MSPCAIPNTSSNSSSSDAMNSQPFNSIKTIANLHQLFIIEQDYCYNKESKFAPPTLFFQGWIREMIDSPKEIDNMCMSICNGQPAQVKYTNKENRKHPKHVKNLKPLWYLEE